MKKRCICGQADTFPLCDGQHGTKNWKCAPTQVTHHTRVIIGSHSCLSLVEYLAHKHKAMAAHQHSQITSCEELIIIHDGHQLDEVIPYFSQIQHQKRRIINLGCPPPYVLYEAQIDCYSFNIALESTLSLNQLHAVVTPFLHAPAPLGTTQKYRIFISHAVHDEVQLMPCIHTLRTHYDLEIFVCADSITLGDNWYRLIEQNLRESDFMIAICSQSFNQSAFCGFEIGMARALKHNIYPILLDSCTPPAYVQHLNAVSVNRLINTYPWFSQQDALLQACFSCLQTYEAQQLSTE
jgi:hypothetical protein